MRQQADPSCPPLLLDRPGCSTRENHRHVIRDPTGRGGERLAIGDARLRGSRRAAAGCAVSCALWLSLRACVHVSGIAPEKFSFGLHLDALPTARVVIDCSIWSVGFCLYPPSNHWASHCILSRHDGACLSHPGSAERKSAASDWPRAAGAGGATSRHRPPVQQLRRRPARRLR